MIDIYDTTTLKWKSITFPTNIARGSVGMAALYGLVFFGGGVTGDSMEYNLETKLEGKIKNKKVLDEVLVWNETKDDWDNNFKFKLSAPRDDVAAVTSNNLVHTFCFYS